MIFKINSALRPQLNTKIFGSRSSEFGDDGNEQKVRLLLIIGATIVVGLLAGLATVLLPNPLIGFGAAIGLAVVVPLVTRSMFALSGVIAIATLLPYAVIPIKLGLTFTMLEVCLIAVFLIWLTRIATHKADQETFVTTPFNWAVLLFVGMCIFALVLGWNNYTDLQTTIHNFAKFLLAILSFFAVINLVRTQAAIDLLLRVLTLTGSLAAFIGVALYRLPASLQERILLALRPLGYPTDRVIRYVEDNVQEPQRATSTSVDPNSFAGMLVLIVALIFTQLVSSKPLFKRWQLLIMLAVTSLAIIWTYSRAAQLGTVAVILVIATVKYRRIWLYLIPVGGISLLILPNTPLWSRFAGGFALADPATLMRLREYSNATEVIKDYPWFGVGFVGFGDHAPVIDLSTGVSMIYLTIAERMGLVGLAGFVLVMLMFFIYVIGGARRIKDSHQEANLIAFAVGIVGALTVGTLDFYYFDIQFPQMAALFWLTMGLAVAQIKVATRE